MSKTNKLSTACDEIIQKHGNKYVLKSHKGKTLGTHPSKAAAERQETAINISKAKAAGHKVGKK